MRLKIGKPGAREDSLVVNLKENDTEPGAIDAVGWLNDGTRFTYARLFPSGELRIYPHNCKHLNIEPRLWGTI